MTLTGMRKHVGVLEQAGLVAAKKIGRVRTCQLGPRRLEEERAWLERYRQRWDERFDELDSVVEELTRRRRAMHAIDESRPGAVKNLTTVERMSDREVVAPRVDQ